MRQISAEMWNIWRSGNFVGSNRPQGRATIGTPAVSNVTTGVSTFATTFDTSSAAPSYPVELPNLKSIEISRSLSQDVQTATIELYNVGLLPGSNSVMQPGLYTYNVGVPLRVVPSGIKNVPDTWQSRLVPDHVIRTYQGYGADFNVIPEDDIKLKQTGEWWIDTVTFTAGSQSQPGQTSSGQTQGNSGLITISCRDRAGPGLVDQLVFPPVIPLKDYPVYFEAYHAAPNFISQNLVQQPCVWQADSNAPWVGVGGAIFGHYGRDAFDTNESTYWESIGNVSPQAPFAFEWIQGDTRGHDVSVIDVDPLWGNYYLYFSVMVNGHWLGSNIIPYSSDGVGRNEANIPYVLQATIGVTAQRYHLPTTYNNVQAVRITFNSLHDSGIGPYVYRAGCRGIKVYRGINDVHHAKGVQNIHTYRDYSDIVKLFLSWGGFFWPKNGYVAKSDKTSTDNIWAVSDPVVDGRVWADIEQSGTSGPNIIPVQTWDKKTLMDGINYVRNILAFCFFVDEEGAAVFRSPNIWKLGNYQQPTSADPRAYTSFIPEISEENTLMTIAAKTDKSNTRYRVFVGNANGQVGAAVNGQEPYPVGWKRISIWTDQWFLTQAECVVMADLIALQQQFTFRTDQIVIPGNPAFQIDDQVKVVESVTGESYIHYINSIDSTMDLETGEWIMTLTTNWLGQQPGTSWVFNPKQFSPDTQTYLQALRKLPSGSGQ